MRIFDMQLYSHQQHIIDEDPKKCGLFLGTGSGKTRIALMLARGSTLVICPKTQKEDRNWEREAQTIGHLFRGHDFTTISKETFRRDHATLPAYDTVIVDEAHTCLGVTPNTRYRNKKEIPKASQLYEALEEYLERTKPKRLYLATATIMKSPMTVLAAAFVLDRIPCTLSNFFQWRQQYYTRLPMPGREVWVPKSDSATKDKLAGVVRELGYIGRLQDFFDVPDQTFKTEYVELTSYQKDRVKELALEYPEQIVRIGKRHQVENGILTGDEFGGPAYFHSVKIDRILDYATEFPRMIIVVKYRAQITAIQEALTKAGYCTWTLTGDTKDRGGVIKQANELDGVLIVQAQISAGWEVPNTPVMIFASRTYSFVDYDQALGRIQRANNIKKNLYINLVVKGGIDEAVDRSLANKQDFNERLYTEKGG